MPCACASFKPVRCCLWLSACAALALAAPVHASTDPMTEAVEILMDRQGADAEFLGRSFGPDAATLLSFTSNIDPVAKTFSYSLAPGTQYLGQSLSISGAGSYDFTLKQWDLSGTIAYGTGAWTPTGIATVTDPPHDIDLNLHLDFPPVVPLVPPPPVLDHEATITYEQTASRTVSVGVTNETKEGKVVGAYATYDTYVLQGPDSGMWVWDGANTTYEKYSFRLHSEGDNAYPAGGPGTFTARVLPVPEPSLLLYLTAAPLAGLLLRRRRTTVAK